MSRVPDASGLIKAAEQVKPQTAADFIWVIGDRLRARMGGGVYSEIPMMDFRYMIHDLIEQYEQARVQDA